MGLHNWRAREWKPAIRAAGIDPPRRIYDLRHTYAAYEWWHRVGGTEPD